MKACGLYIFQFIIVFIFCFSGLMSLASETDLIELPPEELARESVTPVFDKNLSTKNRNVTTENRMDLNAFYGWALTEPIANVSKLGISAYYHTSENNAFGLFFAKNFSGVSIYAEQLKNQYSLDFSRAPAPDSTLMLDYNLKAFYGKMSITKKTVFNMHTLLTLMGGVVKYQHKTYPAGALGVAQKFYFTPQWAFRLDLRLFAHNAPIPFLGNDKLKPTKPEPSYSEFSERLTYTSVLDLGLSYLF